MTLTDAEAEAIRVFYCLSTRESIGSTAEAFNVHRNSIKGIVSGRWHSGRKAGERKRMTPRVSVVGREKRKAILEMISAGPKDSKEIESAIGSDPGKYLTELRDAGKIQLRYFWVKA